MKYYDFCSPPEGITADFAVAVTDDSLLPYFRRGDTVFFRRRVDLRDGDVGLFCLNGNIVIRQFCEDNYGTVYLFPLNRSRKALDTVHPKDEAKKLVCYGRLESERQFPLPMD